MSSYYHGPPYATYPQQRTRSPSPPHPQSHPWSYDVPERSRYSPRPSQGPTGGQRTPSAGADSKLPRPLIGEDYYAWRASAPSKYDGRPRAEYVPQPLDPDSEYIVRDASPGIRHHTGTSAGAGFRSSSIRDDYGTFRWLKNTLLNLLPNLVQRLALGGRRHIRQPLAPRTVTKENMFPSPQSPCISKTPRTSLLRARLTRTIQLRPRLCRHLHRVQSAPRRRLAPASHGQKPNSPKSCSVKSRGPYSKPLRWAEATAKRGW